MLRRAAPRVQEPSDAGTLHHRSGRWKRYRPYTNPDTYRDKNYYRHHPTLDKSTYYDRYVDLMPWLLYHKRPRDVRRRVVVRVAGLAGSDCAVPNRVQANHPVRHATGTRSAETDRQPRRGCRRHAERWIANRPIRQRSEADRLIALAHRDVARDARRGIVAFVAGLARRHGTDANGGGCQRAAAD